MSARSLLAKLNWPPSAMSGTSWRATSQSFRWCIWTGIWPGTSKSPTQRCSKRSSECWHWPWNQTPNLWTPFSLHRNCLLQTLKHSMQILEFVKSKGIDVKFHGRTKNEASHYCGQCEVSWNDGDIKTSPKMTILITRFVTFICRLKCSTFSSSVSKRSVTWFIAWAALESSRRRFKASCVSKSTKSTSSCRSTTLLCCTDRPRNQCSCRRRRLRPSPSCSSSKSRPYHNSLASL